MKLNGTMLKNQGIEMNFNGEKQNIKFNMFVLMKLENKFGSISSLFDIIFSEKIQERAEIIYLFLQQNNKSLTLEEMLESLTIEEFKAMFEQISRLILSGLGYDVDSILNPNKENDEEEPEKK